MLLNAPALNKVNDLTLPINDTIFYAPGQNIEQYLAKVYTIPKLSVEKESELVDSLYVNGNLNAARQLVFYHLKYVVFIAKSYKEYGFPAQDLIQEE